MDIDNRGDIEDSVDILSGLILVYEEDDGYETDNSYDTDEEDDGDKHVDSHDTDDGQDLSSNHKSRCSDDADTGCFIPRFNSESKVKLAHFSVKEYLDSERILDGTAKGFHLDAASEHRFLAQSCLTYLMHYSNDTTKSSPEKGRRACPLLRLSANSWYYHSSLQSDGDLEREVRLLTNTAFTRCWLLNDKSPIGIYEHKAFKESTLNGSGPAQAIYFASDLGLRKLAELLLAERADVNALGGHYGSALQAASYRGYKDIVELLLARGAEANASGGHYGNALQAALCRGLGSMDIVERLLTAGADVNRQGGYYGSIPQKAAYEGSIRVVERLLAAGADVNSQGGQYGNALQAAAAAGSVEIVEGLLAAGIDVNAQGGEYGNALHAAKHSRNKEIVDMLLAAGAVPMEDDQLSVGSEE